MPTATVPTDRRPLGFWLKLVDRLLDEGFERILAGAGLTRRHWQALTTLQQGPATVELLDGGRALLKGGQGLPVAPGQAGPGQDPLEALVEQAVDQLQPEAERSAVGGNGRGRHAGPPPST